MLTDSVPAQPEPLKVGDEHTGGIVIYLEKSGERGIIVAKDDIWDKNGEAGYMRYNSMPVSRPGRVFCC